MLNKRRENIRKLEEINKRLDNKAKIFYLAYKNDRLDLDVLNDDMKQRVLKLKEGEGKKSINEKLDDEPELSGKIITKFNVFKAI